MRTTITAALVLFVTFCTILLILTARAEQRKRSTPPAAAPDPSSARLFLHRQGKTVELKPAPAQRQVLQNALEDALVSSQDVLRLAVTSDLLDDLKGQQVSIEAVYPKERTLTVRFNGRSLKVKRLLVPLTGQFAQANPAQPFVTVFHGPSDYASGPYINRGRHYDRIKALLAQVGQKVP